MKQDCYLMVTDKSIRSISIQFEKIVNFALRIGQIVVKNPESPNSDLTAQTSNFTVTDYQKSKNLNLRNVFEGNF